MEIIDNISVISGRIREYKVSGLKVGFVPTMGFLHDGHLSLVHSAKKLADRVVVSIFVNPTQFSPDEDLDSYPRDFQRDETLCSNEGVDIIFYPTSKVMYPDNFSTEIKVRGFSQLLCGRTRPNHFDGVTTVVGKLFNIVQPDLAIFGKKDYQQLTIIKRMAADLNFPIEIIGGETVREHDGLAMSSRNKYLTPIEREVAPVLYRTLLFTKDRIENGNAQDSGALIRVMRDRIEGSGPFDIDYIEIVDTSSLKPIDNPFSRECVIVLAARLGKARLIDNIEVGI
ncbi:pantoate--beta-alanine ligase [bacterium]|nr:pantoate--beta-alanine ligase [bacterium]